MKKTYNFDIFPTISQYYTSPLLNFWGQILNLIMESLVFVTCFFSEAIGENLWRRRLDPPLWINPIRHGGGGDDAPPPKNVFDQCA